MCRTRSHILEILVYKYTFGLGEGRRKNYDAEIAVFLCSSTSKMADETNRLIRKFALISKLHVLGTHLCNMYNKILNNNKITLFTPRMFVFFRFFPQVA